MLNELIVSSKIEQALGVLFAVLEGLDQSTKEEVIKGLVKRLLDWLKNHGWQYEDGEWWWATEISEKAAKQFFDLLVG